MKAPTKAAALVREVLLEVAIKAPVQRVWDALVKDTDAWWKQDFCGGGKNVVGFHFQPKLGGWMYEDWGNGNGLLWGTVLAIDAPKMIQVVGDSSAQWGGPNRGIMEWHLSPADDNAEHTAVRFRHSAHGHVTPETLKSWSHGWNTIMVETLKPYLESA